MAQKKGAILNIGKATAGISFTTLAAIGSATGNPVMAGLLALPAASLAAVEALWPQLQTRLSSSEGQLRLPIPDWWKSDPASWEGVCAEIEQALPALLQNVEQQLSSFQGVVTKESVYQTFSETLAAHRLTWAPTQGERRKIAGEIAAPILARLDQFLRPVIEQIQRETFLVDAHANAQDTHQLAADASQMLGVLQDIHQSIKEQHARKAPNKQRSGQAMPSVSTLEAPLRNPYAVGRTTVYIGFSPSPQNKRYVKELQVHLASLQPEGVDVWVDMNITPGALRVEEQHQALSSARVVILLIDADFLNSAFIHKELPRLLQASRDKMVTVLPIILEPCLYDETALGALEPVNNRLKPIGDMKRNERAGVWLRTAQQVKTILQQYRLPIAGYRLEFRFSVYPLNMSEEAAQAAAKTLAQDWLKRVVSKCGGVLKEEMASEDEFKWILQRQETQVNLTMTSKYRGYDGSHYFRAADVTLRTTSLPILDHIVKAGEHPYWILSWTLPEGLDVTRIASQVAELTGRKLPSAVSLGAETALPIYVNNDFVIGDLEEGRIRGYLSGTQARLETEVQIIFDGKPNQGFYRAHHFFSPDQVLAIWRGEIAATEIHRLLKAACAP